jgi:hypothetical protein
VIICDAPPVSICGCELPISNIYIVILVVDYRLSVTFSLPLKSYYSSAECGRAREWKYIENGLIHTIVYNCM